MGDNIDGEASEDYSGYSVHYQLMALLSLLVLFIMMAMVSGHAINIMTCGNWNKLGDDIDGEAPEDESGTSVSLSSDGTIVLLVLLKMMIKICRFII